MEIIVLATGTGMAYADLAISIDLLCILGSETSSKSIGYSTETDGFGSLTYPRAAMTSPYRIFSSTSSACC